MVTPPDAVGLIHPGSMGSAIGACAIASGQRVLWVSEGRSEATRARAEADGLEDVHWLNALVNQSDLVISIVPPSNAEEVAEDVTTLGFDRVYLDANAISPGTMRRIAARVEETGAKVVDGGIIGGPPRKPGDSRLYLSGELAPRVAERLNKGPLEVVVLDAPVGAASALKMAYAAWTKGTSAMLAAVEALALHEGVHDALYGEWERGLPGTVQRSAALGSGVAPKAWRWWGEMEEIAATFEDAGLPGGFHHAAAEVYRRLDHFKDDPTAPGGPELARHLLREEVGSERG